MVMVFGLEWPPDEGTRASLLHVASFELAVLEADSLVDAAVALALDFFVVN